MAIGSSMEQVGWYGAVVAMESTGEILVGNHRYRVAKARGATHLPVFYLDVPDRDTAIRILLGDNRTSDLATNDDEALRTLLEELAASEAGLAGTAFTDDDLAALLGRESERRPAPSLADRFLFAPFSVLSARTGAWQDRKRRWLDLGIRSEIGRNEGLTIDSLSGRTPDYYEQKRRAEALLGRALSIPEFEERYLVQGEGSGLSVGGASVFDPVLCELAYRWFCPPEGQVLDPFAGGSVRGIVAAALGRQYTGIELRGEQVAANQSQGNEIVPLLRVAEPARDFTPEITPIERHGGVWVKRDDAWCRGGATGAKSRVMFRLGEGRPGIITAGARNSPQIERAALVAQALGIECRIHTPAGADTPETLTCVAAGAELLRHQAGRLSVLRARFREDAEERPEWLAVPFGMGMDSYVEDVAAQVQAIPDDVRRIVTPVGSGSTLAGILRGLEAAGLSIPVLGITLGHDPGEYLDQFAPSWRERAKLQDSLLDFDERAPAVELGELRLDSRYEAKCLPYLEDGDLLWCVGIRATEAPAPEGPAYMPRWLEGDAKAVLADRRPLLPAGFDLLFSCPPYADLERYSDDPRDLSTMEYPAFRDAYREIIARSVAELADDRFAVWVIGEVRGPGSTYRGLVPDTIRAFEDAGAAYYNEAILVTALGSVPVRAPRIFNASRALGRTHQTVLVFVKGDPKRATAACGPVEISLDLGGE